MSLNVLSLTYTDVDSNQGQDTTAVQLSPRRSSRKRKPSIRIRATSAPPTTKRLKARSNKKIPEAPADVKVPEKNKSGVEVPEAEMDICAPPSSKKPKARSSKKIAGAPADAKVPEDCKSGTEVPKAESDTSAPPTSKRPKASTNVKIPDAPADVKIPEDCKRGTEVPEGEADTFAPPASKRPKASSKIPEAPADVKIPEDCKTGVEVPELDYDTSAPPASKRLCSMIPKSPADVKVLEDCKSGVEDPEAESGTSAPPASNRTKASSNTNIPGAPVDVKIPENCKTGAGVPEAEADISAPPKSKKPKARSNIKIPDPPVDGKIPEDCKSGADVPEAEADVSVPLTSKRPRARSNKKIPDAQVDVKLAEDHKSRAEVPEAENSAPPATKKPRVRPNTAKNKQRKTGQQRRKKQTGKKTGRVGRSPLPSFDDDDDDVFAPMDHLATGQDSTGVQGVISNSQSSHSSSDIFSQSMADIDLNGVMDHSYDDADLESNQSSDDDLPDVLSQESNKINEGDIVWAKIRNYPFWPAVVKKLYKAHGKASVFFAGELNKSTQKGKGVSMKGMKPYSCSEKDKYIDTGLKHPKVPKEEFQEAVDLAENYITKRGLGKAQGASFFTIKDYSDTTPTKSTLSLTCTPSMKAGLPLHDTPSSPLTPPCDTPDKGLMDSPIWKTGRALSENMDQSIEEEGDDSSSDVDEETMERRKSLNKFQDRLVRYITKRPQAKEHLVNIFHRKVKSLRHELYFTAGSEAQTKLKYLRGFGPITDDDKQDELIRFLRKAYEENCSQTDKDDCVVLTSYLIDVWFPEVIIFALQKTQRVGHKRAEQLFITEAKNAMEITGGLDIHMPSYLTEEEKREMLDNVPKRAARQLGFDPEQLGLS
ncbi:uncharacterized protein [Amphiura filiformis]|uniref:uncharacterized protein n=1 Tax=Amphiura filiformis TaxID=82378 RepID=UPI003B215BC9